MTVPLLLVLRPLLAEIILSSIGKRAPPSVPRAGQAPRKWGRLAAHLVVKLAPECVGMRTLLPGDKDCIEDDHPSQALQDVVGSPGDEDCIEDDPSSPRYETKMFT